MKKAILVLSTILLANVVSVANAGSFSAIYSLVQRSASKSFQLRQAEREVPVIIGSGQVLTRIPAHEFTLANGLIVSMEDVTKIVRGSVMRPPFYQDVMVTARVDLVITLPWTKLPRSEKALAALNAQLKAFDNEINGVRGMTMGGPKGFYASVSETRRLSVDAMVDAGQLDELLQSAFTKLGSLAL